MRFDVARKSTAATARARIPDGESGITTATFAAKPAAIAAVSPGSITSRHFHP